MPVFVWARKSGAPEEPVFTVDEGAIAAGLVILAGLALWMLVNGWLPQVYAG